MYKIIGADGKEYGPISADQLRHWVAEGRLNAQTRVLPEGATEWKTLGELPEFGLIAAGTTATPPGIISPSVATGAVPANVMEQVNGPAIGLIVAAILGFMAQVAGLIINLGFPALMAKQQQGQPEWLGAFSGGLSVVTAIIGIASGVFVLIGGLKMRKLESHGLVMAASIVAMIPCVSPCCVIGLPIGIWALMILSKPEVKASFH